MAITTHVSGPSAATVSTFAANVPGIPTWRGHAEQSIVIALDTNSNGSGVEYCIKVEENESVAAGYIVQVGGAIGATGDVWQTSTEWGTQITVSDLSTLTAPKKYRFAVKARNEDASLETAYGGWSEYMIPLVSIVESPASNTVTYELTGGDCKISGLSVAAIGANSPGQYKISYTLTRIDSPTTKNNVRIYYSTAARILIDPDDYTEISDAHITGAPITRQTLEASATGFGNSNTWLTCLTLGMSYYGTIHIKVVPYDTATAGSAGDSATTSVSVDNRPTAIVLANVSGLAWDNDTTPEFVAPMGNAICGDYLYFIIVVAVGGTEIARYSSAERLKGWSYQKAGTTYTVLEDDDAGAYGVPVAYAPPTITGNNIKYTFQDALTVGTTYSITIYQAEALNSLV